MNNREQSEQEPIWKQDIDRELYSREIEEMYHEWQWINDENILWSKW